MSDKKAERIACHGINICCQHVDEPMCNSKHDPHLRGRLFWWWTQIRYENPLTNWWPLR